jgi:hypothetical protein
VPPVGADPEVSPIKYAYSLYNGGVTARSSWDPMCVLNAVHGPLYGEFAKFGGRFGVAPVDAASAACAWAQGGGFVSLSR